MAKTIKFNLTLDGKSIRTIEDLQNNFCINDIAYLYEKGVLQRWLEVRGFDEYLKKINAIKSKIAILDIIEIFGFSAKNEKIKEAVFDLHYQKKREDEILSWERKNNDIKTIISDYHLGYEKLKKDMQENYTNMAFIKSAVKELSANYLELFKLNYEDFFKELNDNECLIVYALLMKRETRLILLSEYNRISTSISKDLQKIPTSEEEIIKYFKVFKGNTEGYWKYLETNKKVMVLSAQSSLIGNGNDKTMELLPDDINGKFLLLDGLLFKSTSSIGSVIYMEV